MIHKYVERRQVQEVGGPIQLSSIFRAGGHSYALLTDTAANKTILSEVPARLGKEFELLLKGGQAPPGAPIDLDPGSKVEGYGLFTFRYGPVTYGVPEAGGFKLVTYGERIIKVIPQVNFKKRLVENKVIGWKPEDALLLVERSAGNFSASYSTCFVTAVEEALNLDVPSQAKWTRAVAIELERIYNHLYVFGRLAEAASQNVATAQINALRERVLRLNGKYFGHRYLFGFNTIGGVRLDISKEDGREILDSIRTLIREFSDLVEYFLSSRIFLDRLQGTARLPKQDALNLGAVGPCARGSGVEWDDRLTYPIEPYGDIYINIETDNGEDTMARTMVRIREIQSSVVVLRELLDKMPHDGPRLEPSSEYSPISSNDPADFSFCRIESPSGDLIHVVQLDEQGRIANLQVRPASLVNWIPFAKSLENNVFTDFQFAFESFGLSYADSDR
jgi:Ni,Fe-hydrogenase III large subunit